VPPADPAANPPAELPADLAQLVATVARSAKYRTVSPALIARIGAQEMAKRRSQKEAVKATKGKLHQVAAAYMPSKVDYAAWLEQIEAAVAAGQDLRPVCADILHHHASTRERLPLLDTFYATLLHDLPPVHSILDLACGLNPLTLPWLRASGALADDATYQAVDVYVDLAEFLGEFFRLAQIDGATHATDILHDPPTQPVDLALLLKAIPCLEQIESDAGPRLLNVIQAQVILVSFPVHSLGGRNKGMATTYAAHFQEMVAAQSWRVESYEFDTELVYRIQK